MQGTDPFVISPAGALWFGNIAGRGGGNRSDQSGEYILRWIPFSIEILLLVEYDVCLFFGRI